MVFVCKGLLLDKEERAMIRVSPKNTVELLQNSTVLKIKLHCEGCSKKIRKAIFKFKGVEMVSMDDNKDLVTVKGTMNVEELVAYLKKKLKRNVEVHVPVIDKDKGNGIVRDGEKKGMESKNTVRKGGDRREKPATTDTGVGAGNSKKEGGRVGSGSILKAEGCKQLEFNDGYAYYQEQSTLEYRQFMTAQIMRGPQIFSDENPNSCYVM